MRHRINTRFQHGFSHGAGLSETVVIIEGVPDPKRGFTAQLARALWISPLIKVARVRPARSRQT
jgi:hypothetical protein